MDRRLPPVRLARRGWWILAAAFLGVLVAYASGRRRGAGAHGPRAPTGAPPLRARRTRRADGGGAPHRRSGGEGDARPAAVDGPSTPAGPPRTPGLVDPGGGVPRRPRRLRLRL